MISADSENPTKMGKEVGSGITQIMIQFFSQPSDKLGKTLGSTMGELSGTVAFQALIIAITAGVGTVWTGIRTAIKAVTGIIGKAVKAIATVLKKLKDLFFTIIKGIKGFIKGLGKGTSRIFNAIKNKLRIKCCLGNKVQKGKKCRAALPRMHRRARMQS